MLNVLITTKLNLWGGRHTGSFGGILGMMGGKWGWIQMFQ